MMRAAVESKKVRLPALFEHIDIVGTIVPRGKLNPAEICPSGGAS
jgi:hypothetical protein